MARFPSHPARLALALAVVANSALPLAGCAAASQSAGLPSTSSEVLAFAPANLDAAMRMLLAEPTAPLREVSTETLDALQDYYAQTDYAPLWVGMDGLTQRGARLMTALAKARDAGASALQPIMAAVDERRAATGPIARAELEILLSGALLDAAVNAVDPTVTAPFTGLLPAAVAKPDISSFLSERLSRVDGLGAAEFREDIYERDRGLQVAST